MSYLMQSKMDESVRYGISTLIKLDVIISESTSQDTIVRQLYQTKAMLQAMSDETILSKQDRLQVDYGLEVFDKVSCPSTSLYAHFVGHCYKI